MVSCTCFLPNNDNNKPYGHTVCLTEDMVAHIIMLIANSLVNSHFDPELSNEHQPFLLETNLPSPTGG